RLQGLVALVAGRERRRDALTNRCRPVRCGYAVEEGDPATLRVREGLPADAARVFGLVEEGPREEGRAIEVVADQQAVLGRAAEPGGQGAVVSLAKPRTSDVLEDAPLRQSPFSGNACFKTVQTWRVTHLLASTREGIRSAYGERPAQRPRGSCRDRSHAIAGSARSSSISPAASMARRTKSMSAW